MASASSSAAAAAAAALSSAAAVANNEHLERLVRKRRSNLQYIKRAYEGNLYWMNLGLTEQKELHELVSGHRTQPWCEKWARMGIGLGQILDFPLDSFIPAAVSILDQWAFQCSCKAREDREMYLLQDIRMRNKAWYGSAVPFVQFNVPVQLDYIEVVHSVCDLLSAFYDRLLALPAELPITTYQNIHTIDSHITNNFLKVVCTEVSIVILGNIRSQIGSAESLISVYKSSREKASPS